MIDTIPPELQSILMIALIVFGVIQCFFGYKVFKFIIGIMGFLICGVLAAHIAADHVQEAWMILTAFVVAGLVGAILSYTLFYAGLFIVGSFLGIGALRLVSGFLDYTFDTPIIVLAAVIGGVLAIILQKLVIILATSFNGATNAVTGIMFFVSEDSKKTVTLMSDYRELPQTVLLGIFILGVVGVLAQYSMLPFLKTTKKEK